MYWCVKRRKQHVNDAAVLQVTKTVFKNTLGNRTQVSVKKQLKNLTIMQCHKNSLHKERNSTSLNCNELRRK